MTSLIRTRSMTSSQSQELKGNENYDFASPEDELNEFIESQEIKSDNSYNRKFFILHESLLTSNGSIVPLKHPKSGTKAFYFVSNTDVCELLKVDDGKRSVFYGESVVSDGSMIMLSPIQPVFLVIPYLLKSAKVRKVVRKSIFWFLTRFAPLDQILIDEKFPHISKLAENESVLKIIQKIADSKKLCGTQMFRYNEELILKWLEIKFEALKISLLEYGTLHSSISDNEPVIRRYTYGVLSDFLPEELTRALKLHLKIEDIEIDKSETTVSKRKLDDTEENEENHTPPPVQPAKKTPKISTATKKLQQASKGTKSLTCFFAKKE